MSFTVETTDNWTFTVKGHTFGNVVKWVAAASPDIRSNDSATVLPWANEDIAYSATKNMGTLYNTIGNFEFKITYPNAYYIKNGTVRVDPHVNIIIGNSMPVKVFIKNQFLCKTLKTHNVRWHTRSAMR